MKHLLITLFLIGYVHTEPMKINLVTTNDIHGMISPQTANFMNPQYPPTILGGAAFSKYVDELRDEVNNNGEGLLILDGGNIFQGHPLGIADGGNTMIEWMNRIGYGAMEMFIPNPLYPHNREDDIYAVRVIPFIAELVKCSCFKC